MNLQEQISFHDAHIFRTVARQPLYFTGGKGATLKGADKKTYIDFFSGLAVNNLGAGHPVLKKAVARAMKQPWHSSNVYLVPTQARLAALIQAFSFPGRTFFGNSGAEANEAAYKLAVKRGKALHPEKVQIVAAVDGFHGRTMGALSITGQPKYQDPFAPFAGNARFVPFNDLAALEGAVNEKTAAVFLEPIQGESGVHPATDAYLLKAREVCDRHDALLIFDEVQCGCGRTGKPFGWQHTSVAPDGFTLAKGLGGGLPIGCFTVAEKYGALLGPGDHNSTFGGNPFVTTVALAALEEMLSPHFLEKVRERSALLRQGLQELADKFGAKEVRGRGFMLAVDFEKGSLSCDRVRDAAREHGLLINSIHDHILRVIPPLVIKPKEIEKGLSQLRKAIKAVRP